MLYQVKIEFPMQKISEKSGRSQEIWQKEIMLNAEINKATTKWGLQRICERRHKEGLTGLVYSQADDRVLYD